MISTMAKLRGKFHIWESECFFCGLDYSKTVESKVAAPMKDLWYLLSLLSASTTLVYSFFLLPSSSMKLFLWWNMLSRGNKEMYANWLFLLSFYWIRTTSSTLHRVYHKIIIQFWIWLNTEHKEIMDWKSSFCSSLENSSWLNFKSGAAVKQRANQ